jgi:dTDP-glucose 4,6-dehydratase
LTERLVESGARTRAFVHYNARGSAGWLDESRLRGEIDIVAGDITDRDSLRRAFKDIDAVFHLAALIAIPYSYHSPESYVRTNVLGTLNLLQCARETGCTRVVHTSTSEVYGTAQYVPIPETHPLRGQSPYSASKIGADKLAEAFRLSFAVPIVTVRPFNTFGPRQSTRAVIPTIVTQVLAGGPVRLGLTSTTRDMSYVGDTISGFLRAGECDAAVGQVVNLGTGREISIEDLAKLIARLLNRPIEIEVDLDRFRPVGSEVDRLCADTTQMQALTGWVPEESLESGLEKTIAWLRERREYRSDVYAI